MATRRYRESSFRATSLRSIGVLIPRVFRILRTFINQRSDSLPKIIGQRSVSPASSGRVNFMAKRLSLISLHIREQLVQPNQEPILDVLQQTEKLAKGEVEDRFYSLMIKLYQALVLVLVFALPHSGLSMEILIPLLKILAFGCIPFLQKICQILGVIQTFIDAVRLAKKHT